MLKNGIPLGGLLAVVINTVTGIVFNAKASYAEIGSLQAHQCEHAA
jgi:hypothetical protein